MNRYNRYIRLLRRIQASPALGFTFYLLLITFMVTASDRAEYIALMVFLLPWLMIVFLFLNMPLFMGTFRMFRMHVTKKRNHALEHGTIYFMKQEYGGYARLGGQADYDGFRISGVKDVRHIYTAFERLIEFLGEKDHKHTHVVSRLCGSNVVTAQALGMALLTLTGVVLSVFSVGQKASLIVLAANIVIYVLLRHPFGNWIQKRFFLSLDFDKVEIESITNIPKRVFEFNKAYFVKTKFFLTHPD